MVLADYRAPLGAVTLLSVRPSKPIHPHHQARSPVPHHFPGRPLTGDSSVVQRKGSAYALSALVVEAAGIEPASVRLSVSGHTAISSLPRQISATASRGDPPTEADGGVVTLRVAHRREACRVLLIGCRAATGGTGRGVRTVFPIMGVD